MLNEYEKLQTQNDEMDEDVKGVAMVTFSGE